MSKFNKMLYASFFLSAVCGVILGLIRGGVMLASPYPAFYIAVAAVLIVLTASSYFVAAASRDSELENYSADNVPKNWGKMYSKNIQVVQLISSFLIIMAAVKNITVFGMQTLPLIETVFLFACAVSIFFRVKGKEIAENTAIMSLFPVFFLCFYLLMFYRDTARYSDLNLFGPQILTLTGLVITSYFNAATKFCARLPIFRFTITLFTSSLCIGELVAYVFNREILNITEPSVFLPVILGFNLFFVCTLVFPPIRIFTIRKKKKETPSDLKK